MKKFSRCALILIVATLIAAIGGYIYQMVTINPVFTSTAKIIVTPGEKNESTVRATDGGLVDDFEHVFKSNIVISAAQKELGTTENIGSYLTVETIPNSNIIELTVTNPDQKTAKSYVDTIANNAVKTTGVVSVESMRVLEYGSASNVVVQPDMYKNTFYIAAAVCVITFVIELIVMIVITAFRHEEEEEDEYQKKLKQLLQAQYMLPYAMNNDMASNSTHEESNSAKPAYEHTPLDEVDEDKAFEDAIGLTAYKEQLAKIANEGNATAEPKEQTVEKVVEEQSDVVEEIIEAVPDSTETVEAVKVEDKQPAAAENRMKSSSQVIGIIKK